MPGGGEQDTFDGAPLAEDVYAYKRGTGTGYTDGAAFEWCTVNTQLRGNGTGGEFAKPSTNWMSYLPGELSAQVSGMGAGAWHAVTHPGETYDNVVGSTADFMSAGMADRDSREWGGFGNATMALWEGAGYLVGSATGVKDLGEAAYGVDIASARELSSEERWVKGFSGASSLAFSIAGGIGSYNPALQSFRGGGVGFAYTRTFLRTLGSSPQKSLTLGMAGGAAADLFSEVTWAHRAARISARAERVALKYGGTAVEGGYVFRGGRIAPCRQEFQTLPAGPRASLRTLYLGRDFRGLGWPRSLSKRAIGQVLEDTAGLLEQEPRV